jgi:hypothetical protein
MSSIIIKKTKQTAADEARKVAKQIKKEPLEFAKTVVPPHIIEGGKKESTSPITEAILQDQEQVKKAATNDLGEEEVQVKIKKRLQELEEEIKKIRQERERKEQGWSKAQDALMKPQEHEEKPFIPPQSKKKRGFLDPAKKKKGTKEMGKQRSG